MIYHVFIKDILKGWKIICNIRYDKKTIGKSWKGEEGELQIKPKIVLEIVQKDIKTFWYLIRDAVPIFSSFFLVKPGIKWCSEARRQLRIHFCHFSLFFDFHIADISLFCRLWLSLCSSWSLNMSLTKIFSHLIDFSPKDKLFYSGSIMLSCVHFQLLREA